MSKVLEVENVTMQFGGVVAVNNLNMVVNSGEIVALIGPNGAGKTTAFNVITGVYQPTNGRVAFREETIIRNHPQGKMKKLYKGEIGEYYTKEKVLAPTPDRITALGMARTFQNIRLWKTQTVFDNVLIAKHFQTKHNFVSAMLRMNQDEEKGQRERVRDLLEIVGLSDVQNELATSLPYGKQRRLEIARALAADPKLLLLDEPAAGMNPNETAELMDTIRLVRDRFDMTILLIEHDMRLVSGICERLTVLNFGRTLKQGPTAEVLNDPEVIKAYLGD